MVQVEFNMYIWCVLSALLGFYKRCQFGTTRGQGPQIYLCAVSRNILQFIANVRDIFTLGLAMFEVRNSGRVSEAVAGRIYYKSENLLNESVI